MYWRKCLQQDQTKVFINFQILSVLIKHIALLPDLEDINFQKYLQANGLATKKSCRNGFDVCSLNRFC